MAEANHLTRENLISNQSGAPSSTPDFIGQINVDTTNNIVYVAIGTSGSGDWKDTNELNTSVNSHLSSTSNPHSVTKTQVGLGSVPNTDCTNAANISSGLLNDSRLNSTVTKEGNTFNGNNQLVKTDGSGRLPAIDGSQLTGLSSGGGGLYTIATPAAVGSINDNYALPASPANYIRFAASGASGLFSGFVAKSAGTKITVANVHATAGLTFEHESSFSTAANRFHLSTGANLVLDPGQAMTFIYDNVSARWRDVDNNGIMRLSIGGAPLATRPNITQNYNSADFSIGIATDVYTISLASAVTKEGNTFNGFSQLVKTDGSGRLPAIDGSQLTNLPAGGEAADTYYAMTFPGISGIWTESGTGSASYYVNGVDVNASANTHKTLTAGQFSGELFEGAGKKVILHCGVFLLDAFGDSSTMHVRMMVGDMANAEDTVYRGFGFNIKNGNIMAVCANNATETETDTGQNGIEGFNLQTMKAVYTIGTDIKYYINDVLVATHTTNLPGTFSNSMKVMIGVASQTAASRNARILAPYLQFSHRNL